MKTGYWILIGVAIITLIYGYNQGWFSRGKYPYCYCTSHKQCGRDQYCDGCNCVSETNVIREVRPTYIVRPSVPTTPVMPGPPTPTPVA